MEQIRKKTLSGWSPKDAKKMYGDLPKVTIPFDDYINDDYGTIYVYRDIENDAIYLYQKSSKTHETTAVVYADVDDSDWRRFQYMARNARAFNGS